VTEVVCPFCEATLSPTPSAPIFDLKGGMSRAQRFALVAAVAGQTLVGCSKATTPTGTGNGQGTAGQSGVPTGGQAGTTAGRAGAGSGQAGVTGTAGFGLPTPVYGVALPPDAGKPRDAAPVSDEDAGTSPVSNEDAGT
jgi:hypothetical protein